MRTLALIVAVVLGACAQPKVDPTATVAPVASMASDGSKGTAKLTVAAPCYISDMLTPAVLKFNSHAVLLDGKPVANITSCQYREIIVPAGKHAIRVGDRMIDFGAMFGNGDQFAAPANGHIYFLVVRQPAGPSSTLVMREVSREEALSVIAGIEKQTSKS